MKTNYKTLLMELQQKAKKEDIELPEELNYFNEYYFNPFVKTKIGQYFEKKLLFGFIPFSKKEINYDFPVDLVYLWVDGNDEKWQEKKNFYQNNENEKLDKQGIAKGRFACNDELKYSLRSVELYAPWINKIYIITDNQIPSWLDTTNDKIKVVFHSEFIPESVLPLFNSRAIEYYFPLIPNLSEHFLYANDDMFFNKPITKDFFFMPNGKPIVRLKKLFKKQYVESSMYCWHILKNISLIKEKYKKNYPFQPHHNIDSYLKNEFIKCIEVFKDNHMPNSRFRSKNDFQRSIIGYFMLANNKAVLKKYSRTDKYYSIFEKVKMQINKNYNADSTTIPIQTRKMQERLNKYNPSLFCTNDTEFATDEDREFLKKFLEKRFPIKSQFER